MRSPLIAAALVTIALLWPGHAQEPAGPLTDKPVPLQERTILPADIPIEVTAKKAHHNRETNTFAAEGNVTLRQGNTSVRADSIKYEGNTGELTA